MGHPLLVGIKFVTCSSFEKGQENHYTETIETPNVKLLSLYAFCYSQLPLGNSSISRRDRNILVPCYIISYAKKSEKNYLSLEDTGSGITCVREELLFVSVSVPYSLVAVTCDLPNFRNKSSLNYN